MCFPCPCAAAPRRTISLHGMNLACGHSCATVLQHPVGQFQQPGCRCRCCTDSGSGCCTNRCWHQFVCRLCLDLSGGPPHPLPAPCTPPVPQSMSLPRGTRHPAEPCRIRQSCGTASCRWPRSHPPLHPPRLAPPALGPRAWTCCGRAGPVKCRKYCDALVAQWRQLLLAHDRRRPRVPGRSAPPPPVQAHTHTRAHKHAHTRTRARTHTNTHTHTPATHRCAQLRGTL